jgi:hypothetical protein
MPVLGANRAFGTGFGQMQDLQGPVTGFAEIIPCPKKFPCLPEKILCFVVCAI